MLLHTATGHVQKLNDYKESEWQANGLLWECKEALRGNLCGCPHCLLSDIYNIITSLAHHLLVFTLFFSFFFWLGGVCWDMGRQIEQRIRKGSFSSLWTLPDRENKPLFCEMMLVVSKALFLDYSCLLYLLCREQQLYCIARTNTRTHGYAQMYSMYTHTSMEKNMQHRGLLW